jgi:GNAT superfamily N-acetyltransferase
VMVLGRIDGDPAAIGGVRHLDTRVAEVKSMYVVPAYRGAGVAARLLDELHALARERRCRAVRLDTSAYLTAAVALYRSAGYDEVADYNGNPKADRWFEREL